MSAATARLLHGFLETCLLSLLADHPDYGLGLGQRLEAAGLGPLPGGTLYPALLRLEKRGLVAVTWQPSASGPARKYFTPTPAGHDELAARREEWRSFSSTLGEIIEGAARADVAAPPPRSTASTRGASRS
ncbi:PadR family transcriptional regulator [Actinomyces slackii]|uniref:Transcriptional regulator, Acidobacterial, PadR-family n=2 Tax=Actinomyces slackii TaxID=52774 RepID=A0A3S4SSK4_9ACTO|nr:PadR family transcriptional regulator [Actinomyces slackii]VEG74042.1 transcriptional regulator, Acidobacterial, PadR-family [Actinomyces slackii]